jgi:hypothetical protein
MSIQGAKQQITQIFIFDRRIKMAVYLVDFENVHSEGLTGVEKLGENDECYIFYSVNACSLSFDLHQKIIESKAKFYYKMVDAHGKNALDFQLVTFLGYLVAKHPDEHFYVVSGDKMFCCATDYWCKENVNADVLEDFSELLFMNSNEKNISDYIGQMLTNSYERVLTQRAYRRMPSLTQTQEYLTSKLGKRRAREIRNLLSPVVDCRYDSERLRLFKENNVFEKIGKHGLNENEMIVVEECLKKKIDKKQFNNILSKHFGTIRGGEVYRIVQKIVGDATIDEVMSVPVKDSADAANIALQQVSETEINEAQNVTGPEDTDVWADAQEELPAEKRVSASDNGLEDVLDDEDECNFVNKCISELITVRGITRRITVKYGKDRAEQIIAIIQPFLSNKRGR